MEAPPPPPPPQIPSALISILLHLSLASRVLFRAQEVLVEPDKTSGSTWLFTPKELFLRCSVWPELQRKREERGGRRERRTLEACAPGGIYDLGKRAAVIEGILFY